MQYEQQGKIHQDALGDQSLMIKKEMEYMKKSIMREYFSIPNLMGYLRIILIPVYLYLYIGADSTRDYYVAAGVMFISFMTDFFDGKIARHFDMITEFGKILDPIADKLTQGTIVISFSFRYPAMAVLLVIFLLKECTMGIIGAWMMKKGYRMDGAQMHGKICTAVLDIVMFIVLIFPEISFLGVNILAVICLIFMMISFGKYLHMYWNVWKEKFRNSEQHTN